MNRSLAITTLVALGTGSALSGQSGSRATPSPAVQRAAATITEADVRRRIFVIAHDSMGGRSTPSPGLSKTANYIAAEFRRFGLKPGGDSGTYLMNYPIARRQLLAGRSSVRFGNAAQDLTISTTLEQGAALIAGPTEAVARGEVVLLGGVVVPDSIRADDVKGRVVVYAPSTQDQSINRLAQRLAALGASALTVVIGSDSALAAYSRRQVAPQTVVGRRGGIPVLALLERGVTTQLPEAADQFAQLRAAPGPVVMPMPDWSGEVVLRDTVLSMTRGPNVVGILEGSDPALRNEYLVYSAHMDHVGVTGQPGSSCRPVGADSLCNGADDDGSGTVGVVELAEAFSRPGARPRRSVIFLTVSGEERGLWGSNWFANNPPVPAGQIVANLNADMIGRNWKDTIVVIGKEHSDLGATLARVNAAHPELNMAAIDDRWPQENFYRRSDHYNFAVKGIPILFFFSGVHEDYHRPSDTPDKIDAEKESRILRLMFYLGQAVANAPERPVWKPESYKQIVTGSQ